MPTAFTKSNPVRRKRNVTADGGRDVIGENIREWIRTTNLRLRRPTRYPIAPRGLGNVGAATNAGLQLDQPIGLLVRIQPGARFGLGERNRTRTSLICGPTDALAVLELLLCNFFQRQPAQQHYDGPAGGPLGLPTMKF